MDSAQGDPRELTDEEAATWMRDLVSKLTKEKGSSNGTCSLHAINNPIRRKILDALEEKALTAKEISEKVGITGPILRFHLSFLKSSRFIQIEGNRIDLTPGGVCAVRSHKKT